MANTTTPQKQIFLSYAWANVNVADEIDNTFKSFGITFRRDARDVAYTGSIKDFMNTIGKNDFVLMLISDEYIKSENCMYEVTELFNTHEFEKRILPVIVNKAPVFGSDSQEEYYDYWQGKVDNKKRLLAKHQNEKTIEDKKKIQSIYDYLGQFFQKINDLKSIHFDDLKIENYKPMLERIGLKPLEENIVEQLLEIDKIEDTEEKELAFEKIDRQYPENMYIMFQRAYYAEDKKHYRKTKQYYEELLDKYPQYAAAHYNFALIIATHFQEYDKAREHYEKAIEINPQYVQAHFNLAQLLIKRFQEYTRAREHYERVIEIDPQIAKAHDDLGIVLADYFGEYEAAKAYHEHAISIDANYVNAYYNLASLLRGQFQEDNQVRLLYEKAIEINPQFANAHYNLALFLCTHFKEYKQAKFHFEKVLEINPQDEEAEKMLEAVNQIINEGE